MTIMETEISSIRSVHLRRFQELALYFFIAGVIGHYLELAWVVIRFGLSDQQYIHQALSFAPLPLSEPFGFGAIAAVLWMVPFVEKRTRNLAVVYGYGVVLMAAVEYICALILTLVLGYNRFWNYSTMPFNLQGYICLEASLLFGLVATIFVYITYPFIESRMRRLDSLRMQLLFWGIVLLYALNLIYIFS